MSRNRSYSLLLLALSSLAWPAAAQTFTLRIGSAPLPPTPLVNHGDAWRYRPARTNAPQANWRTAADAALDGTWLSGPGGFGFGDANIVGEATTLSTMQDNYSSLAIRREFTIAAPVDPARRIQLTIDYDDGYVAWLDGMEISRSPNAAGAGNPPPYNAFTVSANHEASCCNAPTNSPTVLDLGLVGSQLAPGPHVFAIQGINSGSNSSDFHLIADLALVGGTGTAQDGTFFSLVNTNVTVLSGTNTMPGSTKVTVNGMEATFDTGTGLWSRTQPLQPGMNRLFISALDASGNILYATNRDVVCELDTVRIGGSYTAGGFPAIPGTTIRVTNDLIITNTFLMQASNSTVVLLSPGVNIRAETNGTFTMLGNAGERVFFLPADGTTPWGGLRSIGTNAQVTLNQVETVAGQIRAQNGGQVLMENSVARDLLGANTTIVEGIAGGGVTARRCHIARFVECDTRDTPTLFEDCLIEYSTTDVLDLKGTNGPIVVRRCTVRFELSGTSNTDGVDYGDPGPGSVVDSCLIHGFPDKGVSIGQRAENSAILNTLIYGTSLGININSSSNCVISGSTIFGCAAGVSFEVTAGTHPNVFGSNNIIWGNTTNIALLPNSSASFAYSDVEGGVLPGSGNISADPLFVNPAAGDFRLQAGSPAIGAGVGGANMGVTFPVGGIPSAPYHLAAQPSGLAPLQIWWREDADNEYGFAIERSTDGTTWSPLAGVGANVTNYADASATLDVTYFYRVRASNASGDSDWSNVASGRRGIVVNVICGTLAASATWSPAQGEYLVCSNTVVPSGVTLTIQAGTVVRLTNAASLRAIAGGTIDITGTEDNKVVLMGIDGTNTWGEISAQFPGASLTIRHADVSGRQTTVYSNAVMLLEDSFFHHYRLTSPPAQPAAIFTQPIILTHFAQPVIVRRIHVREYHETLWRNGTFTIEGSLFENVHGDAVDFDSAQTGSVIRDCTFRHGTNGNVDAVDIGPADLPGSFDVRVENCVMFDFPFDKGVSVGDQGESHGSIVSNCLIYACRSGVMAKDLCDVSVRNCTIVMVTNALIPHAWGLTNYNKVNPGSATGGGITTNSYNNIVWGTGTTISMVNSSQLYCDHNILYNTNWPGGGNVSLDPLFLNPSARDYRLQSNSPAFGLGRGSATLGATFPIGSPLAPSHPIIGSIEHQGAEAVLRFWADNEKTYSVLCSDSVSGGTWAKVADIGLANVPRRLSVTNAVPGAQNRFYRLVTPQLP